MHRALCFSCFKPGPEHARIGCSWICCYFGFNPLLKKYLDQQNFMYQLSILIMLHAFHLNSINFVCIYRQFSVISSMDRCYFMPKPWSSIQLPFKVLFPWMKNKILRYYSFHVMNANGTVDSKHLSLFCPLGFFLNDNINCLLVAFLYI